MSSTRLTYTKPFHEKKIYYSGSMMGVPEVDLHFPEQLILYLKQGGATVLDEHVAIPHKQEAMIALMLKGHAMTLSDWNNLSLDEQNLRIYEQDIRWVDEATHVISLLNGISTGVGMELQEALRKPAMGLPVTPVLGLVHVDFFPKVSCMVKGAAQKYPHVHLSPYTNLSDAQAAIHRFLTTPFSQ